MTCEEVRTRLDEYVDGELEEAAFQEAELHLAHCADCRREERGLRSLLALSAALPRGMAPARDLWPEVAARLRGAEGARATVHPFWRAPVPPVTLAAAAAVVVALSAGLWTRARGPEPPPRAGTLQPAALGAPSPALVDAERDYARAAADLMAAIDQQGDALSPETRALLQANLASIDQALAQVRAALRRDPGNPQLTHLLTSTYQKKVDALQRVVRLNRL